MGNSLQPSTMGNSPRFSTMDNSSQQKLSVSVGYQHGTLQTDISNLQTSEVESLEINWSDTSPQEEYTRCREEILRFLKSHKFPKVKRLVLNNLFYSEELVENLLEKFPNIEHLKILPFNSKNDWFQTNFMKLTALSELEIALGFSDDIGLYSTYTIEGTHSKHIQSGFQPNCIGCVSKRFISLNAHHSSLCKCSYG